LTVQEYTLQHSAGQGQITRAKDSDPSAVVTFPESSVRNYTPQEAAKYAVSANLGP
jgi:hypothetical protein